MEDTASSKLLELRTLHSQVSLISGVMRLTVTRMSSGAEDHICEEEISDVLEFCTTMMNRLEALEGPRPNLFDIVWFTEGKNFILYPECS